MKYFYKALIVLSLPLCAMAQSNYKPGYAISVKGDTLRGFIDYRDWDVNPATINFKNTLADNSRRLGVEDITYFNVNNLEAFQRYNGAISMDQVDVNHINNKDTTFKTETVFLKVLQPGSKITLYSYTDNLKTRFYIKDANDGVTRELIYRIYTDYAQAANAPDKNSTVTENTYLKQLLAEAQKYNVFTDNLQWDLDHANYTKSDLLKIATKINGISKAEFDKKYNEETKFNFVAGLAANVGSTKPSGPYQTAGGTSYTSTLPALSLGINVFVNPNTGKLLFRLELMATENQYKSSYTNKVSPYIPVTYTFNRATIGLSPQVIYNIYNEENFKFYLGVGAELAIAAYSNKSFGSTDGKTPANQIVSVDPFDYNSLSPSVLFKAGVQFSKNWGIFANYFTQTRASTENSYFVLDFSSIQVGVNYYFH